MISRNPSRVFVCPLILLVTLATNCTKAPTNPTPPTGKPAIVVPRGDRLLGADFLNASETGSFEGDYQKTRQFGLQFLSLGVPWNQLEPAPGQFADPLDAIATLGAFAQQHALKLSLTISPIDIPGRFTPAYLGATRFNSPLMKSRFEALLGFVFSKVDYHLLTSLQIGNEIDGYNTTSEAPSFWDDYGEFLFEIRRYVDTTYPGLQVGFTVTLAGVTTGPLSSSGVFQALANATHVVGVTYYPLNPDFTVMDPSVVSSDIDSLTAVFPGKTIYLQEAGYPTGAICNSSDSLQAVFIRNLFTSWDAHQSQIRLLDIVRLNDVSQSAADGLGAPYGTSDPAFIEYLRTLGLRTYPGAGVDKTGFYELKKQANDRGWVDSSATIPDK